jgi:hypothetical protein
VSTSWMVQMLGWLRSAIVRARGEAADRIRIVGQFSGRNFSATCAAAAGPRLRRRCPSRRCRAACNAIVADGQTEHESAGVRLHGD